MPKYVHRPVTDDTVAAIQRWLRIQMRRSKRFGYCAEVTSVYLTNKLFDLGVYAVADLWIPKEFNSAEICIGFGSQILEIEITM